MLHTKFLSTAQVIPNLKRLYRRFLATPLPMDYVNRMYATQYAKHFWTDAERAAFTTRWTAL